MRYVLGLDGGGTKVVAVLAAENGQIVGEGHSGPANMNFTPEPVVRASLHAAIAEAVEQAYRFGHLVSQIEVAYVGISGRQYEVGDSTPVPIHDWRVAYEYGLCLASGLQAGHAALILAGTGAFQYARGSGGEHRTDGRGSIMGDEGSAYWVAQAGLIAVARAMDGRGPETLITVLIMARLEVTEPGQIITRIYDGTGLPRHEMAGLAHEVTTAAVMGDPVAIKICQGAAERLAEGLLVCANRTGLVGTPFNTVLSGGLFQAGSVITEPLGKAVAALGLKTTFVEPEYAPVYGGVLLGLAALGVPWSAQILDDLPRRKKGR